MTTKQTLVVNDKDVFDYLKVCMYGESINELRRSGKKIHRGVFYETIRMLENVEIGLTKIEENIISTRAAYLDSDDETKEEIIYFLSLLRLDRELVEFAEKVDTFFSIQMNLFIRLVNDDFPEFYIDDYSWTQSNLPLNRIFDCIAKYRHEYELHQEAINHNLEECNEKHIGLAKIFDKIIKKAKKVYILNLAIKISPNIFGSELTPLSWERDSIEHVIGALRSSYSNIVANFHVYADFVNIFMGANESLNLHIALILSNEGEYNSKLIAKQIWHILNSYLNKRDNSNQSNEYDVKVDSLNERIKHHFKQRHVTDVLGYRPKKQLEDFNHWYLYLFTHFKRFINSDQYRFKYLSFDRYEIGYRISDLFDEIKKAEPEYRPKSNKAPAKDFSLRLLYREFVSNRLWEKAIYRLDNKKEYVGLYHVYDEQKYFFKFESDTNERLQRQELFIQYLKQADIPPISTVDAELEHIVQSPNRYLSLIEKLAIVQLLDHCLSQNNSEHLTSITKGTNSPSLHFLLNENKKNRDVVKLLSYEFFSLNFYKQLHKYLYDLKVKLHKSDIVTELAKGTANKQKNYKSINQYLRYKFKQDVDVYRFKMTCKIEMQNVPDVLLIKAFSEIWTAFVKEIKRKPKIMGKQLVAHVGVYVSLTAPSIDVTLIFESENKSDFGIDIVNKINESWKNYLTDETKSQLIRKLDKRKSSENQMGNAQTFDYDSFFNKLTLESIELPLIKEKVKRQGDDLLCNYKDKKQRSRFIKALAEYYANYSLVKRVPIKVNEIGLNLMLKGRLSKLEEGKTIPELIFKPDTETKD